MLQVITKQFCLVCFLNLIVVVHCLMYLFDVGQQRIVEEKELEPWDPSVDINGGDISLELEPGENGWDANDMFRKNEQIYGVTSTYDQTLSSYTVQLQPSDSPDYR